MSEDIKIYHVETQEDYDDLMIKLEEEGSMWASGDKPTSANYWHICEKETVIYLGSWRKGELTRGDLSEAKSKYPTIPIIKHKAKGVNQMEKVVVPQFVVDYIENHYGGTIPTTWDRADLIRDWDNYINVSGNLKVKAWIKNESNFLTFITAIITNNYEVEEKKYYWRKKKEYMFEFELLETSYLRIFIETKRLMFGTTAESGKTQALLTESQVRQVVSEEDFNKLERVEIDDV